MEIYNGNYYVYIHTNKINFKRYVGITCQKPERRWRNGDGYKKHKYFWCAIKKYGWDNFEHEIVASCLTEDEAKNFEIILIKELQTNNGAYGYNQTNGGDGVGGYIVSEETKRKISAANKGKVLSEASKRKVSQSKMGHPTSEETRKKIGEKHKRDALSPETLRKMSESQKVNPPNAKSVVQYTLDGEFVAAYKLMIDAAERNNISAASIYRGCKTHRPVCGYCWEYKNREEA